MMAEAEKTLTPSASSCDTMGPSQGYELRSSSCASGNDIKVEAPAQFTVDFLQFTQFLEHKRIIEAAASSKIQLKEVGAMLWIRSVVACLIIFILFHGSAQAIAQKQLNQKEVMTNQDVIDYVGMGLSEENIITKIKQSTPAFDTTKEGLAQLRKAGVSNRIIAVILNPNVDPPPPPESKDSK